jgi:hypothetical protein
VPVIFRNELFGGENRAGPVLLESGSWIWAVKVTNTDKRKKGTNARQIIGTTWPLIYSVDGKSRSR